MVNDAGESLHFNVFRVYLTEVSHYAADQITQEFKGAVEYPRGAPHSDAPPAPHNVSCNIVLNAYATHRRCAHLS
jgi:hypothetical protein